MGRGRAPTHAGTPADGPGAQGPQDGRADVGVRGIGPTKAAAFEQAALALTGVMADPAAVEPRETVTIACSGADDEGLLVAWLNALIGEMAARHMLFSRFHVEFRDGQLLGSAGGEPICVERHHPVVQVTRATGRDLRVTRTAGGDWLVQTVVDL